MAAAGPPCVLSSVATSFNDGRGAYSFCGRRIIRSATDDQAAASESLGTDEADGTRTGEMIVGGQRMECTVPEGGWVEAEPIPFTTPPDWEHDYAGTTGFQLAPVLAGCPGWRAVPDRHVLAASGGITVR